MSSDYIDRLRHELLRAGATAQSERRSARARHALRRAAAVASVAAFAAIVVAVVLAWLAGHSHERPVAPADGAVGLTFRVEPSAAVERAARVMRERVAAAGIEGARVSISSTGSLTITAPSEDQATVTALARPGRVAFYDWERSVLGPRGMPAASDPPVTSGPDPGRAAAVTKAEAEARAAAVPDARVVRAEDGGGWFALGGEPAVTDADIAGAEAIEFQATRQPMVIVDLTRRGQTAFTELTRELARRGRARADGGRNDAEATQHLAIVIDDRIVAVPFIDFRVAPNGIDGTEGAQIGGDLTRESARQIASIIASGPLPGSLTLAGR